MLEASGRLERVEANVLTDALLDSSATRVGAPREAWLPELKVTAGRSLPLAPRWNLELGASVALLRAVPETESFDPSSPDVAWTDRVDVRAGVTWTDGRQGAANVSVEAFDLLDSGGRSSTGLPGRSIRLGLAVTF
jgi:hypothetical protein